MIQTRSIHQLNNGDRALDRCRSYLSVQLLDRKKGHPAAQPHRPGPAVTVSHQTGSGARGIVRALANRLQQSEPPDSHPWTIFDRRLMESMLEEHNLPKELAKYLPEDRRSYLQDTTEELLGLRPPSWKIVPETVETILHLVEMGHAIVVGRGGSAITAGTPNVFHVRLVAPLARRVDYVRHTRGLTLKEATVFVEEKDRARARYVKSHFQREIDDPTLYHAIINIGRLSVTEAAQWIAQGARACFDGEKGGPS